MAERPDSVPGPQARDGAASWSQRPGAAGAYGRSIPQARRPPRHRPSHGIAGALSAGLLTGLLGWLGVGLAFPRLAGDGVLVPMLLGSLALGAIGGLVWHLVADARLPESEAPPRVLILGGGFGGVSVARRLEALAPRTGRLDVTLVSASNSLLFTPMLAEVASGALEGKAISVPLRTACPRTRFRHAMVERIDLVRQLVWVRTPAGATEVLPYDHLVLALGSVPNYLGLPGVEASAFPLKTLEDAARLRDHVIGLLEQADGEEDPSERQRQLTFVVAGGGFAGTEIVAGLHDFVHGVLRYYPGIHPRQVRFLLVHARERILPELGPELARYAQRKLQARGIEVVLGTRVLSAGDGTVTLSDGRQVPTSTLVWTTGNRPNPLLADLPLTRDPQGRLLVDRALRVRGTPNVWALGDCAQVPDPERPGHPCPPTAQHAVRQGVTVADNLVRTWRGRRPRRFAYRAPGFLVALGHRTAAAELGGLRFSGLPAWLLWRGVYLVKLPGVEKRLRVLLEWLLELFFPRDIALGPARPVARPPEQDAEPPAPEPVLAPAPAPAPSAAEKAAEKQG